MLVRFAALGAAALLPALLPACPLVASGRSCGPAGVDDITHPCRPRHPSHATQASAADLEEDRLVAEALAAERDNLDRRSNEALQAVGQAKLAALSDVLGVYVAKEEKSGPSLRWYAHM